jgi:hypothetical protein
MSIVPSWVSDGQIDGHGILNLLDDDEYYDRVVTGLVTVEIEAMVTTNIWLAHLFTPNPPPWVMHTVPALSMRQGESLNSSHRNTYAQQTASYVGFDKDDATTVLLELIELSQYSGVMIGSISGSSCEACAPPGCLMVVPNLHWHRNVDGAHKVPLTPPQQDAVRKYHIGDDNPIEERMIEVWEAIRKEVDDPWIAGLSLNQLIEEGLDGDVDNIREEADYQIQLQSRLMHHASSGLTDVLGLQQWITAAKGLDRNESFSYFVNNLEEGMKAWRDPSDL